MGCMKPLAKPPATPPPSWANAEPARTTPTAANTALDICRIRLLTDRGIHRMRTRRTNERTGPSGVNFSLRARLPAGSSAAGERHAEADGREALRARGADAAGMHGRHGFEEGRARTVPGGRPGTLRAAS